MPIYTDCLLDIKGELSLCLSIKFNIFSLAFQINYSHMTLNYLYFSIFSILYFAIFGHYLPPESADLFNFIICKNEIPPKISWDQVITGLSLNRPTIFSPENFNWCSNSKKNSKSKYYSQSCYCLGWEEREPAPVNAQ